MIRTVPLEALCRELDSPVIEGDPRVPVTGITVDSRAAKPGFVFAALRGERMDGHRFVPDALARGAAAVLSEQPRPHGLDCSWVRAADAREALAVMAREFNERPDERLSVIGVTGTNGKTTVTYLLESIVRAAGMAAGVLGTVSYRMGEARVEEERTPAAGPARPEGTALGAGGADTKSGSDTGTGMGDAPSTVMASRTTPEADALFSYLRRMADAGCAYALIEVSSHALVLKRVYGVRFAAAVFTNLTQDHLDFHGSMDAYFAAKSLLFRSLLSSSLAVLNADSPYCGQLASLTRARVVTYGASDRADARVGPVTSTFAGVSFDLTWEGRRLEVVSPLPGRPHAENVAAAATTALALGLDPEAVLRGVRACAGAPGRFESIARGQDFHVIVDYAHSDDALARVLETLRELSPRRILTVFGCGGDRDRTKRPLMGAAAAAGSDEVILTSDNPRTEDPEAIMDDAERGVRTVPGAERRFRRVADRREAIAAAIAMAGPGDAVLIAGKGHETTQTIGDRVLPFDDRLVAAECLDRRMGRG